MKNLLLFILLIFSNNSFAQIYGNTQAPDYGSYGANQIVWLKIVTGPSDTGFFTHYGIYDHPTQGSNCDIKFAVYSQHPTFINRPSALLTSDYLATPVNGVWNEHAMTSPVPISPSTTYWIGLRFSCDYGSGRVAGTTWANQPLRFYGSWSFFSSWPDPVGSSPSTFGSVNNVSLYLVGNNMTLPVEMLDFSVEKRKEQAQLRWTVETELNNEGWNIQRSSNGFTWETIGFEDGKGTSQEVSTYNYTDRDKHNTMIFYRLEQVDYDGTKSYSDVKSIDLYQSEIKVYPSTVNDILTVTGLKQASEYSIYSIDQKIVKEGRINNDESIDLNNLHSGSYYISVANEVFKIIKI